MLHTLNPGIFVVVATTSGQEHLQQRTQKWLVSVSNIISILNTYLEYVGGPEYLVGMVHLLV